MQTSTPLSDPLVIASVIGPVLGAAIGIGLDRWLAHRPKLITYQGHNMSQQRAAQDGLPPLTINAHSIWVANVGRSTAHNVMVTHRTLDGIDFQVHPVVAYTVDDLPQGGKAIRFPKIVAGGQVQIQYVGINRRTDNIMVGCYSDESAAKVVPVAPSRVHPRYVRIVIGALVGAGVVSVLVVAVKLAIKLWLWLAAFWS